MICIGFFLAVAMALMQSALLPSISLFAFAPFIALACIRSSFKFALWLSALAGFCSDLISSDPFGIHSISAVLVCALLHRFRLGIFKDFPLQLSIFSALVAVFTIVFEIIVLFICDKFISVEGKSQLLDFIEMPFIHAAYAFFWFTGPILLWEWLAGQWKLWRLQTNATP